ncbi:hypothetical protein [Pseudomonas syringae]|uniref:hypothetical protein n=1 Tax=Pseudomonas syringae TaxID=317 RepID=UPI00040E23B6|nr:hypothetical protein [Pseudomonas syringae]
MIESPIAKKTAVDAWQALYEDSVTLLERPGAHHKLLIVRAHQLHRANIIEHDELGYLLELADSALEYAIVTRQDCEAE